MTLPEQQAVQPKSEPKAPLIRPLLIQVSFFESMFSAYGLTVVQAVNDQERTNREATNEGNSEVFTEGGAKEHDNAESTSYCYAENQDGEVEHEEAYEEYADAQEYLHTSEDAHAREEADQVVAANNEPESVLEVDVIHEGSADPESTEDQESEELRENDDSGDAEAGAITEPSTRDKENIAPHPELDAEGAVPIEARNPLAEGKSAHLGVSEGRSLIAFLHLFFVTHISQKNRPPTLNSLDPVATSRTNKSLMCLQVCRSNPFLRHFI